MSRERGDGGRYTEAVTPMDVLGVFGRVDGPVVTSGDVADALDCSRETGRRKLTTLEAQGRVASRKTAGRVIWWLTESPTDPSEINPEDPIWRLEPGASGEHAVSETVDEELYGA